MPEQAASPSLERHASARAGTLVRSASGLSREGGPSGGDKGDEIRYWGEEIVGTSGLKNLGKSVRQPTVQDGLMIAADAIPSLPAFPAPAIRTRRFNA